MKRLGSPSKFRYHSITIPSALQIGCGAAGLVDGSYEDAAFHRPQGVAYSPKVRGGTWLLHCPVWWLATAVARLPHSTAADRPHGPRETDSGANSP